MTGEDSTQRVGSKLRDPAAAFNSRRAPSFTKMFRHSEDELEEFLRELGLVESIRGGTLRVEVLHLLIGQADGVRVDTNVMDDVEVVEHDDLVGLMRRQQSV